jgi:hypothetical protein
VRSAEIRVSDLDAKSHADLDVYAIADVDTLAD